MFFKKKCPSCGAKNPRGNIACEACGALFDLARAEVASNSGQIEEKPTEVPRASGRKRSRWFWVGIALLSLSLLFWLMITLTMISDPRFEGVDAFVVGVMFTTIPIGIGIYSLRRSRKTQDTPAEIVSRLPELAFWSGLLFIVFGIPIILLGFDGALTDKDLGGGLGLIAVGIFAVLIGIWFMGITTKVTFDQPPGYLTVTLGHIPVFLWFLRKKRISREEARTVTVTGHPLVKIVMKSGKELKLWTWRFDEVEPLARRILAFVQEV